MQENCHNWDWDFDHCACGCGKNSRDAIAEGWISDISGFGVYHPDCAKNCGVENKVDKFK